MSNRPFQPLSPSSSQQNINVPPQPPTPPPWPHNVVYIREEQTIGYDNSVCLYVAALMSIFVPLVGIFTLLIYHFGCQENRSEREKLAYKVLVGTTIFNFIIFMILIFKH